MNGKRGRRLNYRYKRHITNTLLYAVIITALIALLRKQYAAWIAIIFALVFVALLAADRYVENQHLKEEERKGTGKR